MKQCATRRAGVFSEGGSVIGAPSCDGVGRSLNDNFPLRLRKTPSRLDPACTFLRGMAELGRGRRVHYIRGNLYGNYVVPICNGVTTRVLVFSAKV